MIKTLLATWAMLLVAPTGLNLIQEQPKETIAPTLSPKRAATGSKVNLVDMIQNDGEIIDIDYVFEKGKTYTLAAALDLADEIERLNAVFYSENATEYPLTGCDMQDAIPITSVVNDAGEELIGSEGAWYYGSITMQESVKFVSLEITSFTIGNLFALMLYEGSESPEDSFYRDYDPFSGMTGPIISGSSGSYFANVDNPVTVEYLQSFLVAYDETDGDLTDQIQVSKDEYTGNEKKVGEYEIVFSVSDKAGNESTFTLVVYVQDKSKPVISGPQTQRISYTEPTTAEALKSQYSVSDNVDTNLTLAIESDTYTENASVPGTYRIIYAATDSSENKVTYVVDVTVIDDVAPTITGADKVEKSLSSILTSEEIIAEYTATDEIDGDCTITIQKDDYAGNGNKVGNYQIILQASDKSNNVATKTITVTVFDDIKPIWYIKTDSNIVINVDETLKLTETDIKRVLAREDYYNPSEVTVFKMTDVDGYFANGDEQVEPGEYDVVYNIKKQNGESEDVAVTLKVRSVEGENTEKPEEENVKNWFEKNFDFKEQTWGAIVVEVLAVIILISIIAGIIKRRR